MEHLFGILRGVDHLEWVEEMKKIELLKQELEFMKKNGTLLGAIMHDRYVDKGSHAGCFLIRIRFEKDKTQHMKLDRDFEERSFIIKYFKNHESIELLIKNEGINFGYHKNLINVLLVESELKITNELKKLELIADKSEEQEKRIEELNEKLKEQESKIEKRITELNNLYKNSNPAGRIIDFGRGFTIMHPFQATLESYLKQRVGAKWKLRNEEACKIISDVLEGAYHLRSQLICHRDIHSGNIFIDCSGHLTRIRIGDYGCCMDGRDQKRKGKNHPMLVVKGEDDFRDIMLVYDSFSSQPGYGTIRPPENRDNVQDLKKETCFYDYYDADIYAIGMLAINILEKYTQENVDPIKEKERKYLINGFKNLAHEKRSKRWDFKESIDFAQRFLEMYERKSIKSLFLQRVANSDDDYVDRIETLTNVRIDTKNEQLKRDIAGKYRVTPSRITDLSFCSDDGPFSLIGGTNLQFLFDRMTSEERYDGLNKSVLKFVILAEGPIPENNRQKKKKEEEEEEEDEGEEEEDDDDDVQPNIVDTSFKKSDDQVHKRNNNNNNDSSSNNKNDNDDDDDDDDEKVEDDNSGEITQFSRRSTNSFSSSVFSDDTGVAGSDSISSFDSGHVTEEKSLSTDDLLQGEPYEEEVPDVGIIYESDDDNESQEEISEIEESDSNEEEEEIGIVEVEDDDGGENVGNKLKKMGMLVKKIIKGKEPKKIDTILFHRKGDPDSDVRQERGVPLDISTEDLKSLIRGLYNLDENGSKIYLLLPFKKTRLFLEDEYPLDEYFNDLTRVLSRKERRRKLERLKIQVHVKNEEARRKMRRKKKVISSEREENI